MVFINDFTGIAIMYHLVEFLDFKLKVLKDQGSMLVMLFSVLLKVLRVASLWSNVRGKRNWELVLITSLVVFLVTLQTVPNHSSLIVNGEYCQQSNINKSQITIMFSFTKIKEKRRNPS